MKKEISAYLKELDREFRTGKATEHSHRPALKAFLESALPGVMAINEPTQIACGAPDFVLTRNKIPLGYIETKGISKNLDDKAHKAQLKRYIESLDNFIFTNYTEFRLYRDGEQVAAVKIAEESGGRIKSQPDNFGAFTDHLNTFGNYAGQTITTAEGLAKRMASKARMLATVIAKALILDQREDQPDSSAMASELSTQMDVFSKYLIHDIDSKSFADMYAQTVAYGMFAARLHDPTPDTFSRQEAAELIPANNPFLRHFFQHIAGYDLDQRIRWIVDDLADIFRAADVGELMKNYGRATQRTDPFLHFYETFLGEYDPTLRKRRGVFYTPEPVVNFIVRAVDEILRTEFSLPKGLAETSKIMREVPAGKNNKGKAEKYKREFHRVQILDPATGTGTFLAAIVQHIREQYFAQQKGIWPDYVKNDLIPRINGFEVLMASYAMAHTKLEMVLRDSGCVLGKERLRIFLTNSLEEHHPDTDTLFAQWLSTESKEANAIKRDAPVMVVIGNPPYAVSSSNKGEWIRNLLSVYKKDLKERKINLDDDYIKFIRYGEHLVERTGEGVLAYISNNSFLDGITHRQMRKHLMETFDKIYILDLHGNSNQQEKSPDGSVDENVFGIQQGVSINLFVRIGKTKSHLADVFHADLHGERSGKYDFLQSHNLGDVGYEKLSVQEPEYFFGPKDFSNKLEYIDGSFGVDEIFKHYNSGIQTKCDDLSVRYSQEELRSVINNFMALEVEQLKEKYNTKKDSSGWNFSSAKLDLMTGNFQYADMLYRPFDTRKTVLTEKSSGFIGRPRRDTMRHMLSVENVGLITVRQVAEDAFNHALITKNIVDMRITTSNKGTGFIFPLYIYPDDEQRTLDGKQTREPNLNAKIVKYLAAGLGLRFTTEKEDDPATFAPIDLLDYIYAVLNSPSYRNRYKEFLKIDFPRIPYPTDQKLFRKLVELGGELRGLHLLESSKLNNSITNYPEPGNHIVAKPEYQLTDPKNQVGKVAINKTQYFENVPKVAWEFYIGGYQPAQKYLKDRKGRNLTLDEIQHYQKIIVALTETERLMKAIDEVMAQ